MHKLATKAIHENRYSIEILLDLAKAFDTVDHNILIKNTSIYRKECLAGGLSETLFKFLFLVGFSKLSCEIFRISFARPGGYRSYQFLLLTKDLLSGLQLRLQCTTTLSYYLHSGRIRGLPVSQNRVYPKLA